MLLLTEVRAALMRRSLLKSAADTIEAEPFL